MCYNVADLNNNSSSCLCPARDKGSVCRPLCSEYVEFKGPLARMEHLEDHRSCESEKSSESAKGFVSLASFQSESSILWMDETHRSRKA